jgi:hypothetical protein
MLHNKTIYRIIILLIIFFSCNNLIIAQEVVEPLRYNPLLLKASRHNFIAKRAVTDTFEITNNKPFFDDFSQTSYFPKDSLWLDRNVFINSTSAHLPISYGVATFDGLNEFGMPYRPGYVEGKGVPCDTLTSVPINLKDFKESDSLYLSFFYQAQGYGEEPDTYDSLVLEFKPDRLWMGTVWDSNSWVRVWSVPGSKMHPFKQVILHVKNYKIDSNQVPIKIANFYHGGFQFRFINYGNLSGNLDLWNLDYVNLTKYGKRNDTINDIAVVKLPQSLLKDYTSVPASHLLSDTNLFRDEQFMTARNLFTSIINVRGNFLIEDLSNHATILNKYDNQNIEPGSVYKMKVTDSILMEFDFNKLHGDTIRLRSELKSYYLLDIHLENDIAYRYHEFSNYYAYDDGTAENGYSVDIGDYKTARVAYRFKLASNVNKTDSLRGISIFFNYSEEDASDRPFYLMVWNDYNTNPVRQIETVTPIITDSLPNGFYTYKFEHPLAIDSLIDKNGYFYIGWEQNSAFRMNVGLDRNYFEITGDSLPNKANPNIQYYTNNKWKASVVSGALMMRPIISKYKLVLPSAVEHPGSMVTLDSKIYPNPAQDHLTIYTGTASEVMMSITDMQGREIQRVKVYNSSFLSLEGINSGIYIIVLTDSRSQRRYYHKLIIQK